MSERLRQITDEPQFLEEYLRAENRYNTLASGLKSLIKRIDREEEELDIDEKLIVFSYLFWTQNPNFVSIAHCLGEEEEEIKKRIDQIMEGPEDYVVKATCRLIDHVPPGPPKFLNISPELRKRIINLRTQGTPNREIAGILGLKEKRLGYLIRLLLKEGEIESRARSGKKEDKE
jgi:hypothetical protein